MGATLYEYSKEYLSNSRKKMKMLFILQGDRNYINFRMTTIINF